jgi:hypothetical protein
MKFYISNNKAIRKSTLVGAVSEIEVSGYLRIIWSTRREKNQLKGSEIN